MKISRDNYEIWFLDYLEGKLSREDMEEVHHFLIRNPDLADEPEDLAPSLPTDQTITYPYKAKLKRSHYDDPACFETAAVALMEGDLDQEELDNFNNWLEKNTDKKLTVRQLENVRLQPDQTILFPSKESLKKKIVLTTGWKRVALVAAMLALAFYIFYPVRSKHEANNVLSNVAISQHQGSQVNEHGEVAGNKAPANFEKISKERPKLMAKQSNLTKFNTPEQILPAVRQPKLIAPMMARSIQVSSDLAVNRDLAISSMTATDLLTNSEMPLSDYLGNRLQEMKATSPKGTFTREEFAVAGLHFFARLTGHRLTGKKGDDGRLRSISFNTQLLAVTIPLNRQL